MYICKECLTTFKKWHGQCPKCKTWNQIETAKSEKQIMSNQIVNLIDIQKTNVERVSTSIEQLDLVLGGGIVSGSLTLISGHPGIGKSTLLLMLANNLATNQSVLYVSSEENLGQIKLRADRLNIENNIKFLNEQNTENIINTCVSNEVDIVIIDSIQTSQSPNVNASSGSVNQLKAIAIDMMEFAKQSNISVILVGHVTKEGDIAGPKLLEHMVDTVLYIEGESESNVRILRCEKNRFGSTDEIGTLAMTSSGFITYDANEAITENDNQKVEGAVVSALLYGRKINFVDVQALVTTSVYPSPKRSAQGLNLSRLNMLIAICQKYLGLTLSYDDVYVNCRSMIETNISKIDLAVIVAIYSSKKSIAIANDILFVGEVSLTGKVLSTSNILQIVNASEKLGYRKVMCNCPSHNKQVINVKTINEALNMLRSTNEDL